MATCVNLTDLTDWSLVKPLVKTAKFKSRWWQKNSSSKIFCYYLMIFRFGSWELAGSFVGCFVGCPITVHYDQGKSGFVQTQNCLTICRLCYPILCDPQICQCSKTYFYMYYGRFQHWWTLRNPLESTFQENNYSHLL